MEEKVLTNKKHGMLMLVILLALYAVSVFMLLKSAMSDNLAVMAICIAYIIFGLLLFAGFRTLKPQEALVLTLFGKYYGTLKGEGFYYVNPFCSAFNPAANTRLGQSGAIRPPFPLFFFLFSSSPPSFPLLSLFSLLYLPHKSLYYVLF